MWPLALPVMIPPNLHLFSVTILRVVCMLLASSSGQPLAPSVVTSNSLQLSAVTCPAIQQGDPPLPDKGLQGLTSYCGGSNQEMESAG